VAVLRDAGVEVIDGVLAARFAEQNRPFLRGLRLDRPWTIAKWAMTLDGKTAAASGDSRWISGEQARMRVHELRGRVDGVVVGFRTAQRDDPELTVRHVEGRQPLRIVVDPRAALPLDSKLATTARETPVLLLVRGDADPARCKALQDRGVELLETPPGGGERGLDLASAWRALRARGLRRVMVEGGGELLARLVEQDCLDQALCFVAPKLIGGRGAPTALGGAGRAAMAEASALDESWHETCGDDVLIGGFFA
jgi:diaminohydroxyphosphoribosylaminopyrimidine deaminase/5-amino-6-(5-phosphoribosylamino)uracil reductase